MSIARASVKTKLCHTLAVFMDHSAVHQLPSQQYTVEYW